MAQRSRHLRLFVTLAALLSAPVLSSAQSGRFDLSGPSIDVRVTRGNRMLPIASVPNLQAGDKIWLHPDLPPTQSVHYLLIAAFLRGTTNPPPDNWFFKIETWNRKVREEGVTITVPDEAQQAILFLAPETGGDFATLRSAVRGRPGTFVRASQDLAEAGFEQARIEKYLSSIRKVPPSDPKALVDHSDLLARTLNLKPNEDCFKRPVEMQYNCLTQTGSQTLLDDGHGQSVVASLTSGAGSDFINAASTTSMAGGGLYSAYVGAIVDLVRITSTLHTAQYQYIPAIAFPDESSLNLRLNTPPSFHNPKSVIVIGLPAIQESVLPPLRPADPSHITCLLKPRVTLPVEGAPLVFSTSLAHDLVLHLNIPGASSTVSLTPDAYRGGLNLSSTPDRKPLPSGFGTPSAPAATPPSSHPTPPPNPPPGAITGTISGEWGFDAFTGPTLLLQQTPGTDWKLIDGDPVIAGRDNHLTLGSTGTACVESVSLVAGNGAPVDIKWKPGAKPNQIDLSFPLQASDPGSLHIAVHQYGEKDPVTLATRTFSEPATLTALEIHSGDVSATLQGKNLSQVKQMTVNGLVFAPVPDAAADTAPASTPETHLSLFLPPNASAPKLKVGEHVTASVSLNDGRNLDLATSVLPSRPAVTILSKNIKAPDTSSIQLTDPNDLPANSVLTFSLRSATPFPRTGKIEIANTDESLQTTLNVAGGTLVLQNPHTLLATFDPQKAFGTSAFGPLRLRAIAPDGTAGDWLPLATLVRLPTLTGIRCPSDIAAPCTLNGSNLYLIASVAYDPDMTTPVTVPDGFVDSTLSVPRPARPTSTAPARPAVAQLYLRLRDDPAVTDSIDLPVAPADTLNSRGLPSRDLLDPLPPRPLASARTSAATLQKSDSPNPSHPPLLHSPEL